MIRDRYDVMQAEQHGSWNEGDDFDEGDGDHLDDAGCEDDFDREPTWEDEIHDGLAELHRELFEEMEKPDRRMLQELCEAQEHELATLGPHATLPGVLARFQRFAADGVTTKISSRRIVRENGRRMIPRMNWSRYFSRNRDRSWKQNRRAQRHGFQSVWFRSA